MTDLHCHILPNVDDGAPTLEISLQMAREAVASGVDTICATPHFAGDDANPEAYAAKIAERRELLKTALAKEGIPLTLVSGAEVSGRECTPAYVRKHRYPTLNGSDFLLCEFHFDVQSLAHIERVLYGTLAEGVTPVLAHPERYEAVLHDPRILLRWHRAGCLFQVNKASINGLFGPKVQNTVLWFLENRIPYVVATDAHDTTDRRATPMDALYQTLTEKVGKEYADLLTEINPKRIINNQKPISAR